MTELYKKLILIDILITCLEDFKVFIVISCYLLIKKKNNYIEWNS